MSTSNLYASSFAPKAAIIEDDQFVAATIVARLERQNVRASVMRDLASARRAFLNEQYDFAVVDLSLPDGDGLELIKELRSDAKHHDMPLIVATSNHDHRVAMQAYENAGVMLVSHKPIAWACFEYVLKSTVLEK